MSGWLGDGAVAHLRDVAEWPDIGERYEITRRLGRGGMAVVYAGRDRVLDREVAIKVLDDLGSPADSEHLLAEARILGRLEHPGIVPVHDAGTLADGRVFYVMKLVRGDRLDAAIASRSLSERLELFLRICDAVAFAHAHRIVHRDLKPQNVMLGPFGEVLVMDWGVAKVSGAPGAEAVVGTPGYMAPEQEHDARSVDSRADVYALGVILEAMLPGPAPKPLVAIAEHARARQAEQRYDTVQAFAREVTRFREGAPVEAYRESSLERLARVYRRHRLPITLVLAYMIVRVIVLLWFRT
ncbi:MAG TPA: serine/threonine-protein kinase [Vicinamibacterales bacterium]|nr:serine/threonine-protein kinase [Vicinamibacterales bacterium]